MKYPELGGRNGLVKCIHSLQFVLKHSFVICDLDCFINEVASFASSEIPEQFWIMYCSTFSVIIYVLMVVNSIDRDSRK